MQIRKAEENDLVAILVLANQELRETRAIEAGMRWNDVDLAIAFATVIRNPPVGICLVCQENHEIVGYIFGTYRPSWEGDYLGRTWHEVGWYVKPEYRKKGYGLALFGAAEEQVRKDGIARMISIGAGIGVDHEHLIRKYEQAGFVPFQILCFKQIKED